MGDERQLLFVDQKYRLLFDLFDGHFTIHVTFQGWLSEHVTFFLGGGSWTGCVRAEEFIRWLDVLGGLYQIYPNKGV